MGCSAANGATGKTFVVFDLAAALGTGQPFLGHTVKRQCGVLLIAAEGADEVRLRLDAVVREKCGDMARAPFRWYEAAPTLLHKGMPSRPLIAMAQQAEASLQEEFGLPLGLIIDRHHRRLRRLSPARRGERQRRRAGADERPQGGGAGDRLLRVGRRPFRQGYAGRHARRLLQGERGDVVLACLGDKELNGSVTDTRLAVRKHRGGRQGQEYPFTLRVVEAPEPDEDGDTITTMVVDWLPAGAGGAEGRPEPDPWAEGAGGMISERGCCGSNRCF